MSVIMKFIFAFVLTILLCSYKISVAQPDPTSIIKSTTLTSLRNFRDNLNAIPKNTTRDSLIDKTNKLISFTSTQKDTLQLSALEKYFVKAGHAFLDTNSSKRDLALKNINTDLSYKMTISGKLSLLGLEPNTEFFKNCDVNVSASLMGSKTFGGNYTLYWSQFTGIDQEAIIRSNDNDGTSKTFNNPYKLTIRLPGYITFWIQDDNNKTIYKSFPEYQIMSQSDKRIEVNFIPFK